MRECRSGVIEYDNEEVWEVGRKQIIFFFNDTATTEIYTLSLHDALPISGSHVLCYPELKVRFPQLTAQLYHFLLHCRSTVLDRKSTRLNSSHLVISYAVLCLKKKNYVILKAPAFRHIS